MDNFPTFYSRSLPINGCVIVEQFIEYSRVRLRNKPYFNRLVHPKQTDPLKNDHVPAAIALIKRTDSNRKIESTIQNEKKEQKSDFVICIRQKNNNKMPGT